MYMITDGKTIAAEIRKFLEGKLSELKGKYNDVPKLGTILIGDDASSHLYVKKKETAARELGIMFEKYELNENVTTEEALSLVGKLNQDPSCNAILIQLPLPNQNTERILQFVKPEKDVDCLHPFNLGRLLNDENNIIMPPTVASIMKFLGNEDLRGKKITIVGSGKLVGIPLSIYLTNKGATVAICNSQTKKIEDYTKASDIIVSCAGVPNLIKENMVRDGAKVIDAGINKLGDKVVGDVDYENVRKKAEVTPVPGGVGPVTVEMLLKNTLYLFERQMESTSNRN